MPVTDTVASADAPPAAPAGSPGEADIPDWAWLDDLPDGVVVTDADGWILAFNAAAERMLSLPAVEAVGRRIAEVLPLLDEQDKDWWECGRIIRSLPAVTRQPERRLALPSPIGAADRDFYVTVRFSRSQGQLQRVVLSLRDAESRERIERNHSDLVATVAHELRSPLTSVKGFTATLLARWDRLPDETKKTMLQTVNSDADRVTRLLTELLDVSRIDTGRLELHRQVVDLPATVAKVIEGRVAGGDARERFEVVASTDGLPEMWLDPDKIQQVLHNLVENALRHGAGVVRVTVGPAEDGAEITVQDEGDGIPEGSAARVFTKYWRGASRGSGTGLGLYIAKGLVEAHSGSIAAEQAAGGGALFRFSLPAGTPAFAT